MPGAPCDPAEPERVDCIQRAAAFDLTPGSASPGVWSINPATGTYCPPYNGFATPTTPVGYEEYTIQLGCNQGPISALRKCVHPDWERSIEVDPLPGCSKDWEYQGIVDLGSTNGLGEPCEEIQWWGSCVRSDSGILGNGACLPDRPNFDAEDCLCHDFPCGVGECCCPETGACAPCEPPECEELFGGVFWNADVCGYALSYPDLCEPDEEYNFTTCECEPRCEAEEGECWCELTESCIPCDCSDEATEPGQHDCTWDYTICDCDCEECAEGECWCELTESCIECPPEPECYTQLHCHYSKAICDHVCDDTETKCGANREWLGFPDCRCEGSGGVWNLETRAGQLHIADDLSGIRYRRSDDTVPPFVIDTAVTADTADRGPRMVRDFSGRIILSWVRITDGVETFSDDDGETWSTETTVFTGATQTTINVDQRTGLILRGGLIGGEVFLSRQYPGDAAPGSEFLALVNPGSTSLELDDAGFHFSCAHEGPGRWILTGVDTGAVVNYASSDDGETWSLL